jgi:phosphate transporter
LATVALWLLERRLHHIVGDMGIIAIIPLIAFFGTGVLKKEDFNNFLWTVIMLAMGGLALGEAVNSSGLLEAIAIVVKAQVTGYGLLHTMFIFIVLMLVVATFISHTVAAVILLPVVFEVGSVLPDPHPRLLVMGATMMCSCAMGLPVSGFPNMNAIMLEDATGRTYLKTSDFIHNGIPASILAAGVIMTLGYAIMSFMAF